MLRLQRWRFRVLNKKVFFLAGLPRTGSTLLSSILGQNPHIHVTPTSPLCPLLAGTCEVFRSLDKQHSFDQLKISKKIYHSIIETFHEDIMQPIVFNRHRVWPSYVEAIKEYINPEPRIICPVRPIPEIITSYLKLAEKDKNNFIDLHLKEIKEPVNNESRANLLWEFYLKPIYDILSKAMITHAQNILLFDYRDFVFRPKRTLEEIYEFCGISSFDHRFSGIENLFEEKDEAWGMRNLHAIRPELGITSSSPSAYLSGSRIKYYEQFDIRRAA